MDSTKSRTPVHPAEICYGGKFVVSGAEHAHDAQSEVHLGIRFSLLF
jgi:hypothetical protein